MRLRAIPLLILLAATAPAAALAEELSVGPGSETMTAEEQALAANPETGIQDAVILLEETERVQTGPHDAKVWYHLRAKVLSEAGLRLANVRIPDLREGSDLDRWWGRVIRPDGTAKILRQTKLVDQIDPETGERSITGVLPGVVPGSILDWGYSVSGARLRAFEVIPLQREWFVGQLRYRWRPTADRGGIQLDHPGTRAWITPSTRGGVLVSAEGLAPFVPGPAETDRPVSLVLYDAHPVRSVSELVPPDYYDKQFWNDKAKWLEGRASRFAGSRKHLMEQVRAMLLPEGVELPARLQAAHAWIEAHVRPVPSVSSDDPASAVRKTKRKAFDVLTSGSGSPIERKLCFLAIARALGAEASLVLTTDRREWTWDTTIQVVEQFSDALIVVRTPGEPPVFVSLDQGIPYGQVPAETAGTSGLEATKDGAVTVKIPAP